MGVDRAGWEQLAARMRTRWPGQLSNIKSDAYYSALSDLDKSDLERGVDTLIAREGEELPSPNELRAMASGEAPETAAPPDRGKTPERTGEERKYLGIPASWLLSALVAVVVAAVIVVVFVVVFDDNGGGGEAEPVLFEPVAVENELVLFDWQNDLSAADAQCEDEDGGAIACLVLFEDGTSIEVSVTTDESGELTIDVPEDAEGAEGGEPAPEGGAMPGGAVPPAPTETTP